MQEQQPLAIDLSAIAEQLGLAVHQVQNVVRLLDEGNTVPFITRYRKEWTGNLDEEQIRQIERRVRALRQVKERAAAILRLIACQNKLTPELRRQIEQADTLKRLEDLYLPFRPKRASRASRARQRGLAPLAERIWNGDRSLGDLHRAAQRFVDPAKDLSTPAEVLQGASDILAERVSEDPDIRDRMRKVAWKTGRLTVTSTKAGRQGGQEFRDYFDYSESVSRVPPHRVLAVNRGEKAGALRVKLVWDEDRARADLSRHLRLSDHPYAEFLFACLGDALSRLLLPQLEREIRRELTDRAEEQAVGVFARNLRNLLLQPPLQNQRVLAIDPGFRTGCKVAVLDEVGRLLAHEVIYVTGSAEKRAGNAQKLAHLMRTHRCKLIAIGNGTACRETEELVSQMIAEQLPEARYVVVNEAGASIYSTSPLAGEEFPNLDATVRGTISIGRRLQDPLSELVKIEPQHLGVGMYQHDVAARRLQESLEQVIESCVNYVGVDLNTASAALLRRVSGFNQLIARRVVQWRHEHGRFTNRRQLLQVPGIGETTFTQAAGFLKIVGGDEPLDATWIHPESYSAARRLLDRLSVPAGKVDFANPGKQRPSGQNLAELSAELGVGVLTLQDILQALARPGRDPRTALPGPVFKRGILTLDDLSEGMALRGTVLNVVDFGAFVDIGLKDSGLVHVSQLASTYVNNPHEVVAVGDVVDVWVLGIDRERRRVSLTMIDPAAPRTKSPKRAVVIGPDAPAAAPAENNTAHKTAEPNRDANRRRAKPSGRAAPPILSPEVASGRRPMKGFDELKELWRRRNT